MAKKISQVVWADQALQDLSRIFQHIATHFGFESADRITHELVEQIGSLATLPRLGQPSELIAGCREIVVEGNQVYYQIIDEQILIRTIRPRGTKLD